MAPWLRAPPMSMTSPRGQEHGRRPAGVGGAADEDLAGLDVGDAVGSEDDTGGAFGDPGGHAQPFDHVGGNRCGRRSGPGFGDRRADPGVRDVERRYSLRRRRRSAISALGSDGRPVISSMAVR